MPASPSEPERPAVAAESVTAAVAPEPPAPAVAPEAAVPAAPPAAVTPPTPDGRPAFESFASPTGTIGEPSEPTSPPKRKRPIGWIVTVILLSLAVVGGVVALVMLFQQFQDAQLQIRDQQQIIEEQEEVIDTKETFGLAMSELVATASQFDTVPFGDLVPREHYVRLAENAWDARRDVQTIEGLTAQVGQAHTELAAVLTAAQAQAATNATGTTYEAVIDQLGGGFASIAIDDADSLCGQDVWACVTGSDPYVVHYDADDTSQPFMTDFIRTGLSYHEFAHVLQFTNPGPTETAAAAFGGDYETMADCFALTFLPGWTLDHTVWVSDYQYWEVSVGYGYTCDEAQRQVIRDWRAAVGYQHEPISQ